MTVRRSVLLLLSFPLFAPFIQAQNPEPEFAVEIRQAGHPPSYVTPHARGGTWSLFYPEPRQAAGKRQVSAIELEYKVDGGLVMITASAYFGEFDKKNTPVSLRNLPKEEIGSYTLRMDESATISEMEQFGFKPVALKIVPARAPASVPPPVISKAPSIQVAIVGQNRTFYQVELRNLSGKMVTAIDMESPTKGGGSGYIEQHERLLAPGAVRKMQLPIPHSGRTQGDGSFVEEPPRPLVVAAVVFEDGSYEGIAESAARIVAGQMGAEAQRGRIDRLVEPIVADARSGDAAKIARIRSGVAQLTEEPDAQLIESFRTRFPGLPARELKSDESQLKAGLHEEKQGLDRELQSLEEANARRPGLINLSQWWSDRRKR